MCSARLLLRTAAAEIHVNYEQQPEYPLIKTEKPGEKLDWRVTKMRLGKDKTTLIYNGLITLCGIPPESYQYRLGNRSALEISPHCSAS